MHRTMNTKFTDTAFVVFLTFDLYLSFYIFFASLFTFLYIFM